MNYIFINSDVFFLINLDFSEANFENTTIIVPKCVVDDIQNEGKEQEKKYKLLADFEKYKKLFQIYDDTGKNIIDSMKHFDCENDDKYLVTFSTDLLSSNPYRNFLEERIFNKLIRCAPNIYQIFAQQLKTNIERNNQDSKSRYYLSECYLVGRGIEKNIEEWKKELETSGNQGFDIAQCRLGFLYQSYNNIPSAIQWYEKAINNNNLYAHYYLGIIYINEAKSRKKGIELITDAANKGLDVAKSKLGCLYFEGKFVKKNIKEAFSLLKDTAMKGIVESQNILGKLYFYGIGTKKNIEEAIQWTTKAANKQYPEAIYNLGIYYESIKEYNKAVEWFNMSANDYKYKGLAYYKLGLLYESRLINDIEGNPIGKATQCFKYAVEANNKDAKQHLDTINRNMYIEDAFKELNTFQINTEHQRALNWYNWCLGISAFLVVLLIFLICCNMHSTTPDGPSQIQDKGETIQNGNNSILENNSTEQLSIVSIMFRLLATATTISFIFICINQAARMRKTMILLSKEIQEYKYIEGLLKAKSILSIDALETNREISETISKMIQNHLDIQKDRIGKEDHTDIKDITPEILTFFKDNTNDLIKNNNEMFKTMVGVLKGKENTNR